jgi:hypothetical protein
LIRSHYQHHISHPEVSGHHTHYVLLEVFFAKSKIPSKAYASNHTPTDKFLDIIKVSC